MKAAAPFEWPHFEDALQTVLDASDPRGELVLPLEECTGYALAEEVRSDTDMPPFDRSAMDGFAVCGCFEEYRIVADPILAGQDPEQVSLEEGSAVAIMTGAPVPSGADRVVIVEQTTVDSDRGVVRLSGDPPPAGANICRRGEDISRGQTVAQRGSVLLPSSAGILAMAGASRLSVGMKSSPAIVTTGSEVVSPDTRPAPGQVRNANLPLMRALCERNGFFVGRAEHLEDSPELLTRSLRKLLDGPEDPVLIAGGVSMGTHDFVPGVLESLGVEFLFRKVRQKPGKPLCFGVHDSGKLVFGLPGNPVSVLVCMEEYVVPSMRKMSGFSAFAKRELKGVAASSMSRRRDRTRLLRSVAHGGRDGSWRLEVPPTSGSGDLMSTSVVNSITVLPPGEAGISEAETVCFHLFGSVAGEMAFQ